MKFIVQIHMLILFCASLSMALDLRELATSIPNELIKIGVKTVGPYSMDSLLEDFKNIQIKELLVYPGDRTGLRHGMVNNPGEVQYWPNSVSYPSSSVARVWAFHEFLEASGHYDHNYENSVALWWLLELPTDKRQDFIKNVLLLQLAGGGGGITGTGGGGDAWAIATKMILMRMAEDLCLKDCKKSTSIDQIYREVLKLPLETNNDVEQKNIENRTDSQGNKVIMIPVAFGIASSYGVQLKPIVQILKDIIRAVQ